MVLGRVLKWASRQHGRRRYDAARTELSGNARHALGMKRAASDPSANRPSFDTAGQGMRSLPNGGITPSGALDAEGHKPVLERSRKVR